MCTIQYSNHSVNQVLFMPNGRLNPIKDTFFSAFRRLCGGVARSFIPLLCLVFFHNSWATERVLRSSDCNDLENSRPDAISLANIVASFRTDPIAAEKYVLSKSAPRISTSSSGDAVFTGRIERTSKNILADYIRDNGAPKRLRVTSAGGDLLAALVMAESITKHAISVVVDGYCLSSCANTLISASNDVRLRGVVGFHGSGWMCTFHHSFSHLVKIFGLREAIALRVVAAKDRDFLKQNDRFVPFIARSHALAMQRRNSFWLFPTDGELARVPGVTVEADSTAYLNLIMSLLALHKPPFDVFRR
jgi:hypothetical protein